MGHCLVTIVVVTMMIHGYFGVRQDQENIGREIRVGMRGLTRAIQVGLRNFYGDLHDLKATQNFVDAAGLQGNIHGLIVYNPEAQVGWHRARRSRRAYEPPLAG
jgi:hypothetical protein